MTARFAALESRANRAVFSHLGNVTATVAGLPVDAIFDAAYQLADVGNNGMATTGPVLTLATSSVPSSPVGQSVVVGGKLFAIVAHEPDGTGMSMLMLQVSRDRPD